MKNKLATAKKFVSDHRVAIAVTATATLLIATHVRVIAGHNEFLKEHELFDEFYAMTEED